MDDSQAAPPQVNLAAEKEAVLPDITIGEAKPDYRQIEVDEEHHQDEPGSSVAVQLRKDLSGTLSLEL